MNFSKAASVFFAVAVLALLSGCFFYKKSEEKKFGLREMIVCWGLLGCYHCFVAAILNLLHVPVNIIYIGICDLFMATFFWQDIIRKKRVQKFRWEMVDGVFVILVAALVMKIAKIHYGGRLLLINYWSIDAGVHFRTAMDVVNSQTVDGMFYDTVWNALLIECLGAFKSIDFSYQWYVLGDLLNLCMAAGIFYAIARKHMKNYFSKVMSCVLGLLYMIAFPVTSMFFGFTYLGMGVTVVGLLIIMTEWYIEEEVPKFLAIMGMMLGCFALFETYVLFAPITYFAIISCIFVKQYQKNKLISKETIGVSLAVFLIPCLLGMWYTYRAIFTAGVTIGTAITNEGGCYRELYTDFLVFLPIAVLGYIGLLKSRKNIIMLFLTPYFVLFTLVIFAKTLMGTASSYYYYKLYYLIWLLIIVLNFYGIAYAEKQTKVLIGIAVTIYIGLMGVRFGHVEEKIAKCNPNLITSVRSTSYFHILNDNEAYLYTPAYSQEKLEMYHWVTQNLLQEGEEKVPGVIVYEDSFWFQDITNQRFWDWDFYGMDVNQLRDKLKESKANYAMVLVDSPLYNEDKEYYDALERVYTNEAGFVVKLP